MLLGNGRLALRDAARLAGALWVAGAVLMYPLGIVYAVVILGVQSTPPTVLVGAFLLVVGGGWMALTALRRPSAQTACGGSPTEGAMTRFRSPRRCPARSVAQSGPAWHYGHEVTGE